MAVAVGPVMGHAAANTLELAENELLTITGSEDVQAAEARIAAAVATKETAALQAVLSELELAPHQSPVAQAVLRYTALMAFSALRESRNARRMLETYASPQNKRGPEIRVLRTEEGHRAAVIVFDPVAAARFSLGAWNTEAWAERVRTDLAAGRQDFIEDWLAAQRRAGGRLSANGLVRALRESSPGELAALPGVLRANLDAGEPVAEIARAVATRLHDPTLARAILRTGDAANALAFLPELREFPAADQLALMEFASNRHELGSAAIYAMARLGTRAGTNALIARLGSPKLGTSAAAALAREPDTETLNALNDVVRSDKSVQARRRAVLALQLSQSAASRAMLDTLSRDGSLSRELRNLIAEKL